MTHKMRTSLAIVALVLGGGVGPAWADRGGDGEREGGGGSGCHEVNEGARCEDNDLSPSFKDSPVDRSFNPTICVLPDSCHFHEGERGEPGEEPEPESESE